MSTANRTQGKSRSPSGSGPRPTEGLPLQLALVFLTVAMAYASVLAVKVCNAPVLPWVRLAPMGLFALSVLAVGWVLRVTAYRGDTVLVSGSLLLSGLGIVMQLRVGAYASGLLELVPVALGVGLFLIAAILAGKGRAAALAHTGWLAYLGALGLMGLVVAFGQRFRGGLFLPGNYNPTEIAKPLLVLFLAAYVSGRQGAFATPNARALAGLACLWMIPMAMTVLLGDLGLTLLLCGVLVLMLYACSRKIGWLAVGTAAVLALALLGGTLSAHAHVRFAMWRNPFLDPTGKGWQVLQALSAMYAGGLWGCGLGAGAPSVVPIVSSDFIYAAFGEEIGWAGCALILCVFGLFCARGWRAAANAGTPFVSLLATGLTSCLAAQILLNVAGVTKALPLTGLTLPFISHGGSSLVTSFLMAGLLAAISERK